MAIALNLKETHREIKKKVINEFRVTPKKTQFVTNPEPLFIFCVNQNEGNLYIPIGVYGDFVRKTERGKIFSETLGEKFPNYNQPKIKAKPKFKLLTKETDPLGRGRDQDVVFKKAMKRLEKYHTVFISCFTGFGKTKEAIYLLLTLGYKAGILCHNDTIKGQWKDELAESADVKVQIVSGNQKFKEDVDIYIIGILKAKNLTREEVEHIGTVIIDEAHICTISAFTCSLLKFQPKYLIGLSATPERSDGLQNLLTFYFGPKEKFIVREEIKNFTVIKYTTNYTPEISYNYFQGETVLAWSDMMTSIAEIKERQIEIANIAIKYPTQKIILICDRVNMAKNIYKYLTEKDESVELFIENQKTWDKTKRIMITSVQKGGVGLNDPSLTMLILAADMKNVKQCEGRIRTTNNIVVDIVDDYETFERHYSIREKWYLKRGATIEYDGTSKGLYFDPKKKNKEERFLKPLPE
jgi:hypothetical protein